MTARRNAAVAKQMRARRLAQVGAPPGTLVASTLSSTTEVRVFAYDGDSIEEHVVVELKALGALLAGNKRIWIDVDGLGDLEMLKGLAALVDLHPLALEDVLSPSERSKVERFRLHHFIVIRMPGKDDPEHGERLSMFMGRNYVLTFQGEHPGDSLDTVRSRLRKGQGRIRHAGADYLAYALVDAVVDHYFPHAEALSSMLDALEEEVLGQPSAGLSERIHAAKRQARALKRSMATVRDSVLTLQREPSEFICDETRVYLRDCLDHAIEIGDRADSLREQAQGLMDLHLSMMSARMNDVMRVLAVVTTVFTPLTFLAGVYGMNFDPQASPYNMPELRATYGYPIAIASMAVLAVSLLAIFARRGWLSVAGDLRRADETWYGKFLQPLSLFVAPSRTESGQIDEGLPDTDELSGLSRLDGEIPRDVSSPTRAQDASPSALVADAPADAAAFIWPERAASSELQGGVATVAADNRA